MQQLVKRFIECPDRHSGLPGHTVNQDVTERCFRAIHRDFAKWRRITHPLLMGAALFTKFEPQPGEYRLDLPRLQRALPATHQQ